MTGLVLVLGVSLAAAGAFFRWLAPEPDDTWDNRAAEYNRAAKRAGPGLLWVGFLVSVGGVLLFAYA
jgi:hypothetical protein